MIKKGIFITICLFFMTLLSGCEQRIVLVDIEFGQFPRVVYIANIDTELDFSDVTIVSVFRDGYRFEHSFSQDWLERVEHSIDFTTPGVYEVVIALASREHLNVTFLVQVIDEEIFNQLSGRQ